MPRDHLTRRSMVKLTGAVAAGTALAGCSSGDSESTDPPAEEGGNGGGSKKSFDGWFEKTETYDGVVDETGSSSVTVKVGVGSNGFNFDPPAIKVASGTTVTWKWTGKGGSHNVVAEDGSFESKLTDKEGHTFEHTFDSTGTYKYKCNPHSTMGMHGVVIVE